tara:strand:+ start:415 stop:1350 length:936 start_codon:yes stop_codon:yes gene_type:complete
MLKLLTIIYLIVTLSSVNLYANDDYKIIVKVNDKIISNYDLKKEKRYLSALSPEIANIDVDEFDKIAKRSLIREVIKYKEVSKYYDDVDFDSLDLIKLVKNLYTRLNISSKEEFEIYLKKYDLDLKLISKKIGIESNWNALIYEKYKDQVIVDKDKIKKKLELESSSSTIEKLFLLSELVFTAKDKEDYESNYKNILNSINEKGFASTATIYSLSDTAKFGGKIGWMSKNDINEKIYNQIYNLKINEFSKPLKIGTGFLLINIDDIKEEQRENNLEEQYSSMVGIERNRQLNQFSNIYFRKIKKQMFIYEY